MHTCTHTHTHTHTHAHTHVHTHAHTHTHTHTHTRTHTHTHKHTTVHCSPFLTISDDKCNQPLGKLCFLYTVSYDDISLVDKLYSYTCSSWIYTVYTYIRINPYVRIRTLDDAAHHQVTLIIQCNTSSQASS